MTNKKFSTRAARWEILPNALLHGKILALQNEGEKILDVTVGVSNLPIPESGKKAVLSAIINNDTPYTAVGGDNKLKHAIIQKLKKQNNITSELENIIVTTGAKQAIFQALYVLTNPGDTVAVIRPYWPAYTQVMEILQLKPFYIDLNDIHKLNQLSQNTPVKVLLFDLPHNPTGKVFTKQELEGLLSYAKKKDIFIIADESYEKLVYEGKQISLVTLDKEMENNILTIFSVSQSFSMMGWRLGYSVAQEEIITAMEAVQSAITAATPAISQTAVTAILNAHDTNAYLVELAEDFKQRRDTLYPFLKNISWLSCELPASGPYFWCNIEKLTKNSEDFARKLLEKEKIAVLSGEIFGTPGWIRIAFNVQPVAVLKDAIERIHTFGDHYEKNQIDHPYKSITL